MKNIRWWCSDVTHNIIKSAVGSQSKKGALYTIFIQFSIFFGLLTSTQQGFTPSVSRWAFAFITHYINTWDIYTYVGTTNVELTRTPNITNLFPDLTTSSLCYMIIIFCCYFLILNFFLFFFCLHLCVFIFLCSSWVIVTSRLMNWCDFYWFLH